MAGGLSGWLSRVGTRLTRMVGGLIAEPEPLPFADAEVFKRHIFSVYRFTSEAQGLLADTPMVIHNLREPVGGGGWYGPATNRIELQGIQDEAAVHELAHAYADFSGFYTEYAPDWPHWKTRNHAFRAAVHRAAVDNDPRYARISFICREYEFGNPETGFEGMFENDPERFAGLASGCMGDLLMLPPHLRPWYRGLFLGTRGDDEGHPAATP